MPIDVAREQLLTFADLARRLPRRRRGRPVHTSTIHRWRSPGIRSVRLEAVRIGGAWHTSWEAFTRFCEALTALEPDAELPATETPARVSGHDAANSALENSGW